MTYISEKGIVARIIYHNADRDTVSFKIANSNKVRTWEWDKFIKMFSSLVIHKG